MIASGVVLRVGLCTGTALSGSRRYDRKGRRKCSRWMPRKDWAGTTGAGWKMERSVVVQTKRGNS